MSSVTIERGHFIAAAATLVLMGAGLKVADPFVNERINREVAPQVRIRRFMLILAGVDFAPKIEMPVSWHERGIELLKREDEPVDFFAMQKGFSQALRFFPMSYWDRRKSEVELRVYPIRSEGKKSEEPYIYESEGGFENIGIKSHLRITPSLSASLSETLFNDRTSAFLQISITSLVAMLFERNKEFAQNVINQFKYKDSLGKKELTPPLSIGIKSVSDMLLGKGGYLPPRVISPIARFLESSTNAPLEKYTQFFALCMGENLPAITNRIAPYHFGWF